MSKSIKAKVYEEVLRQLQDFILMHKLEPGSRLPSERELAEQLNASRSSVREALRAIELLGLIETRQGEGTFLRTYQTYHLVDLLATFILRDPNTKHEILFAKKLLEKEIVKLVHGQLNQDDITALEVLLSRGLVDNKQRHYSFFSILFAKANNFLLQKIWNLMEDFSYTMDEISYTSTFYNELITVLKANEIGRLEEIFERGYASDL